jgi:hypothetical protein
VAASKSDEALAAMIAQAMLVLDRTAEIAARQREGYAKEMRRSA